jgi:hypothetical protein
MTGNKWTSEQDDFLLSASKEGIPWDTIVNYFQEKFLIKRTKKACKQRHYLLRNLNQLPVCKAAAQPATNWWTKDQEEVLRSCRERGMRLKRIAREVSRMGVKRTEAACELHFRVMQGKLPGMRAASIQQSVAKPFIKQDGRCLSKESYLPVFLVEAALEQKWAFQKIQLLNEIYKLGNISQKCSKEQCIEIARKLKL